MENQDKAKKSSKTSQVENILVSPTLQAYLGKVKEEDFSDSDMKNDFEDFEDNETDKVAMNSEIDNKKDIFSNMDDYIDRLDRQISKDNEIKKEVSEKSEAEKLDCDVFSRFTCETCLKTFELAEQLIKHVNRVHKEKSLDQEKKPEEKYRCHLCPKAYGFKQNLKRHIMTHNKKEKPPKRKLVRKYKLYQCHVCQKQLKYKKRLDKHIIKEHSQESYQCPECPKIFITRKKFLVHHAGSHAEPDPAEQVKCEVCLKIFSNAARLHQHVKYTHNKTESKFCEPCNKAYTPSAFRHHIQTVHGEKAHTCDKCGISFHFRDQLARHDLHVHQKVKAFVCNVCGKAFSYQSTLQQHIEAVHNKTKPYKCKLCGDRYFTQRNGLFVHLKGIHKIEQPKISADDRVT